MLDTTNESLKKKSFLECALHICSHLAVSQRCRRSIVCKAVLRIDKKTLIVVTVTGLLCFALLFPSPSPFFGTITQEKESALSTSVYNVAAGQKNATRAF
jgi:hypothetical protein